jgi:nicotinate phosphoribosyltransferase
MTTTTALHTDRYELTMLQAALRSGVADRRTVFEVFTRRLPEGRRYGVIGGLGRLVTAIERFTFGDAELAWLEGAGVVDRTTRQWLSSYRFTGTIDGYAEGELYFAGSPVLTVDASFGEAIVLETLILSILNFDSAVAAAALRMVDAAEGRPMIEMGSRRTDDRAAVAAARVAWLAGFSATSNLEAGRTYGVPTAGTAAHAFVLAYPDEEAAFTAQLEAQGSQTTLLVDTYDIDRGIKVAIDVAGPRLRAIRIDSGELGDEAYRARALLDSLGATETRVVVTGDLDEHSIAALASAPVDVFGAGTSVVTGSGAPTAGFVYKLVARANSDDSSAPLESVEKRSPGKASRGGRKWAWRLLDAEGKIAGELIRTDPRPPRGRHRPLQVPVWRQGQAVYKPANDEVRDAFRAALAELPAEARGPRAGPPATIAIEEED